MRSEQSASPKMRHHQPTPEGWGRYARPPLHAGRHGLTTRKPYNDVIYYWSSAPRSRRSDVRVATAILSFFQALEHLHATIVLAPHDHVAKNQHTPIVQFHRQMTVSSYPNERRGQGPASYSPCGQIHRGMRRYGSAGDPCCRDRHWDWSLSGLVAVISVLPGRTRGRRIQPCLA